MKFSLEDLLIVTLVVEVFIFISLQELVQNLKLICLIVGVYRESTVHDLYVDITKVAELTSFDINKDSLTLGANVTLAKAMSIFESSSKQSGFAYLEQMRYHIDLIANVPVRNVSLVIDIVTQRSEDLITIKVFFQIGTIAGNLMIKHQHNEFQSDIFLILETFKATIIVGKVIEIIYCLSIKKNTRIF